jgi:hypothetical protein
MYIIGVYYRQRISYCNSRPGRRRMMEIPANVAKALKGIRASGVTNMFDRATVIRYVDEIDGDAAAFLRENKDRYISILEAAVHGETWLND